MMKEIKYSYCIDENNNLIHINNVTKATRHNCKLFCLQCGQEMVANLGPQRARHFSHKANSACNGESYLHKLAKRRILEKFQSSDYFGITFIKDIPCNLHKTCFIFNDYYCLTEKLPIPFNLKTWYDTCKEEIKVGEFRPDLLLTYSGNSKREHVFIEIYKTHQVEKSKAKSKYRIIETQKLKSEDDVEDIINNGFVEGRNCQTFNFTPQLPSIRKTDVPIERFILSKNGFAQVFRAHDNIVYCAKLNEKVKSNSACELNIKEININTREENVHNWLDSYELGLVYLIKKGWQIRNCILCKFRKYNIGYGRHICIRYKSLGEDFQFPHQTMAQDCPYYTIDQEKINFQPSQLESLVSEVKDAIVKK